MKEETIEIKIGKEYVWRGRLSYAWLEPTIKFLELVFEDMNRRKAAVLQKLATLKPE